MESQPSSPSIIVISDSEEPCDVVDPDECPRVERSFQREADVVSQDVAHATKRRRLVYNSSSDDSFTNITGDDDTASDPAESDDDSDSDDFEFENEDSPLRSHSGDGFVQFVTSAFPRDDAHAKGKAFEGFLLNWFLVTYPEYQNKFVKLWSYEAWPKPRDDIVDVDEGIDIIALDTEGKICAIQAKCWGVSKKLPYREISTFLASSSVPYIDYRLLIATCELGRKASRQIRYQNEQKQVHTFLLSDFTRWNTRWPASLDALSAFVPRAPHQSERHQIVAIDAVCHGLSNGGRGQLIMACGTGKTLTSQRISERLECNMTLVLVPSLVLLRDTMSSWLSEKEQSFHFLAVCSDETVVRRRGSAERSSFTTSELHCKVTTRPEEIAQFLNADGERKVMFATYQSSPRIAEAFESHCIRPFDLIIADEAHRCAGKVSADFATVLWEDRLPSKRRLFMTATPRLFTSSKTREHGLDIVSMDDESLFGPVIHRLSFRDAIHKDLLTDYRVVIVGVNEARYREMVDERLLVRTEAGFEDDARSLATRIGLAHAVQLYDLRRIITFHSRVALAQTFAAGFDEFLGAMKPMHKPPGSVTCKHVDGEMTTSLRSKYLREMRELENEYRYLIANCRCLSEGVDVPALDCVAFMNPKSAEVDIIQAVGRVMRRDRTRAKQKTGTIVIPVFVSDEEDVEESLKTSKFQTVWKVIKALRAHDDVLGNQLDRLRVRLGRDRTSGNIDLDLDCVHVDMHETVGDGFIRAFLAKTVDMTTSSWEEYFAALERYKDGDGNGDPNCPTDYVMRDMSPPLKLGTWLNNQRQAKKGKSKCQISAEQILRMEELGVWWDQPDTFTWDEYFAALERYKDGDGNGDPNCPTEYITKDTTVPLKLGKWLSNQRQAKKGNGSCQISAEQIRRLEELGVWWDQPDPWEGHFAALKRYKDGDGNGNPNCTKDYVVKDTFPHLSLGLWLRTQRAAKRGKSKCRISDEQIRRLEELGVWWDKPDTWEEHFSALKRYKDGDGNGNPNCTKSYVVKDTSPPLKLGLWLRTQRQAKRGNGSRQISAEQIRRLEELGVWWEQPDTWEEHFAALKRYKDGDGNGDPNCTKGYVAKDTVPHLQLAAWLVNQRQAKRGSSNQKISAEQIRRLEELGVWWEKPGSTSFTWEESFAALERYKSDEGNGDPNCPAKYVRNDTSPPLKLGVWLRNQRRAKRSNDKSKISDDRIRRLEELGVWWDQPNTFTWDESFAALERYKAGEGNGDPNCPASYVTRDMSTPLKLGKWLSCQRQAKKGNGTWKISAEQIRRLEKLGVWWDKRDTWEEYFAALKRYKDGDGKGDPNCKQGYVTKDSEVPLKLGKWLSDQRQAKKGTSRGQITDERIHRLEELGVWWDQPDTWEVYFAALKRYKDGDGNGDPNCPYDYVTNGSPPIKLGLWLSNQRRAKKGNGGSKISDERIRCLEDLGVWWDKPDNQD